MEKTNARNRIAGTIKASGEDVFLRSEFSGLGNYRQVGRALAAMVRDGALIRVGHGIYVCARPSSISGNPVPTLTIMHIGLEAMRKLGVEADIGKPYRDLRDGLSTQMPMRPIISVGKSRVRRAIGFGARKIYYET